MKYEVYAKQGNTSWQEWIEADSPVEATNKIIEVIDTNPYNSKYNEFAIKDEDGVIVYEGEWWFPDMVDEDDGESEEWVLERNALTESEIKDVL